MTLHRVLIALESAHAVWGAVQVAKTLPKDKNVVLVSLPQANPPHRS